MKYYQILENPILLKKIAFWCILGGIIIVLLFLAILFLKGVRLYGGEFDMAITGQVGDFIGGFVGSIWTVASIVLFVAALKMQNDQLEIQKNEINQQSKEISKISEENSYNRIIKIVEIQSNLIRELEKNIFTISNKEGPNNFHQMGRSLSLILNAKNPIGNSSYIVFLSVLKIFQSDKFKEYMLTISDSIVLINTLLSFEEINNRNKIKFIWIYFSKFSNLGLINSYNQDFLKVLSLGYLDNENKSLNSENIELIRDKIPYSHTMLEKITEQIKLVLINTEEM